MTALGSISDAAVSKTATHPITTTLSPRQAAQRIGIGKTKLLALIHAGRIKAKNLDGRIRVSVQSLDEFVADLPDYAAPVAEPPPITKRRRRMARS